MGKESNMARVKAVPLVVFLTICLFLATKFTQYLFPVRTPRRSIAASQIIPGATWTAINTGHHIQAHGGGIIKVEDTYYWIGENKADGTFFQSINCYSSTDLAQWSFVGALLTRQEERGDLGRRRIVERPKVIHNRKSSTYVMYMHIDDELYQEAKVGVATSTGGVCDPYSYKGSFRPLDKDNESRDLGLFQDADGKAYLMSEDRKSGLHIYQLSATYESVTERIYTFPDAIESPALVYMPHFGHYIIFGSHLTGWRANDNVYSFAPSLSGPWSAWKPFAREGSNTYNSQTTFVLPIGLAQSSEKGTVIWMGDRWDPDNLMRSTYIWQPLDIRFANDNSENLEVQMENLHSWTIDLQSGGLHEDQLTPSFQAETAQLGNGSIIIDCDRCESGKGVSLLNGSYLRLPNVVVSSATMAVVLVHYFLDGKLESTGELLVNNGPAQAIGFLPAQHISSDGLTNGSFTSSITAKWNSGPNVLELHALGEGSILIDHIELSIP